MSVQQAGSNLKTAILDVELNAGAEGSVQQDAMEKREIAGLYGRQTSQNGAVIWFLWVGSDPYVDAGSFSKDNEQFAIGTFANPVDTGIAPKGEGWEWNEGATLTLEAAEAGGVDPAEVTVHVYYRELE